MKFDMNEATLSPRKVRPLVTFALFAYNQEDYIRKAIEGAFSQDYEPLEIVLSDDCSTDKTFEIMQELSLSYRGPHKVRAIRHQKNVGTLNHVLLVARVSYGDLFVVNAGDDISYQNRTSELVLAWQRTGAIALSSFHDEISKDGDILGRNISFPISNATQIIFGKSKVSRRIDGYVQNVPGFAAAYERQFLIDLPLSENKILIEDGTFGSILNIRGDRIERVKISLIAYRILSSSLSIRQSDVSTKAILRRENKINKSCQQIIDATDYIIRNAARDNSFVEDSILKGLEMGRHYAFIVQDFWIIDFSKRVKRLLKIRSVEEFFFFISRIFGFRVFALIKLTQLKLLALRSRIGWG